MLHICEVGYKTTRAELKMTSAPGAAGLGNPENFHSRCPAQTVCCVIAAAPLRSADLPLSVSRSTSPAPATGALLPPSATRSQPRRRVTHSLCFQGHGPRPRARLGIRALPGLVAVVLLEPRVASRGQRAVTARVQPGWYRFPT